MGSPVYGKGYHDGFADGAQDARDEAKLVIALGGLLVVGVTTLSTMGVQKLRERRAARKLSRAVESFDEEKFLEDGEGDA